MRRGQGIEVKRLPPLHARTPPPPTTIDAEREWIRRGAGEPVEGPDGADGTGRQETSTDVPSRPRRALLARKRGPALAKLTVYIDGETSVRLSAFCEVEGRVLSRVVDAALREYLASRFAPGSSPDGAPKTPK